jgi:hypothetical protein
VHPSPLAVAATIPVIPPSPADPGSRWLADWDRRDFLELGAVETAPRTVRGLIRELLPWWGLGHLQDALELVATELITNSVAATRDFAWDAATPPVRVWLLGGDLGASVLVWDAVPHGPVPREAADDDESGRGLSIVHELSTKWDFYFPRFPFRGKVTWAFIS